MARICVCRPCLPALALAVVLLATVPLSERFAACQGLDLGTYELLGVDLATTAYEFKHFEDTLALLYTNRGRRWPRGRGAPRQYPTPSSSSMGGFENATYFQQLQAAYYYLGGAPMKYESSNKSQTPVPNGEEMGLDYVPTPFDQQQCSTCVGHAAAMAVRMSIAYTLRKPVKDVSISPLAFYYCSSGGKTCLTGWDIQPALAQLEANPQLLLPTKCFEAAFDPRHKPENKIADWASICTKATTKSKNKKCKAITKARPLYTCTYKTLNSFHEIQQHIRQHGAVITRIAIPDDFEIQFNSSERVMPGLKLEPYKYNVTARVAYGHAAVIVGYDNDAYTWTLLNSWGRGTDPRQTRLMGGVTADGLFKIRMGVAVVGMPEKSYGVACEPAAGTKDNFNGQRPWLAARRKPLLKVNVPGEQYCFNYTTQPNETVASIVDHFGLDVRSFVQMNAASVGKIGNYTFRFPLVMMQAEKLNHIHDVVVENTKNVAAARPGPYYECWIPNATAPWGASPITCGEAQPFNTSACAELGANSCKLLYKDVNTTVGILPNTQLTVCNEDWADVQVFNSVAYEVQPVNGNH